MFCLISVRIPSPRSHAGSPQLPAGRLRRTAQVPFRLVVAFGEQCGHAPGILRFRTVPPFLQIRQSRLGFPRPAGHSPDSGSPPDRRIEPRGRLELLRRIRRRPRTGLRDGEHLVQAQLSPAGCAGVPALRPHRIPGCGNLFCNPCGAAPDNTPSAGCGTTRDGAYAGCVPCGPVPCRRL